MKAVNQLIGQKDELLPVFKANVERVLGSSNSAAVAEVDEKLLAIQKELLKKADARQGTMTIWLLSSSLGSRWM